MAAPGLDYEMLSTEIAVSRRRNWVLCREESPARRDPKWIHLPLASPRDRAANANANANASARFCADEEQVSRLCRFDQGGV